MSWTGTSGACAKRSGATGGGPRRDRRGTGGESLPVVAAARVLDVRALGVREMGRRDEGCRGGAVVVAAVARVRALGVRDEGYRDGAVVVVY